MPKRRKTRKTTKSLIHNLIDQIMHPHFDDPAAIIIDSLLHAIVEQDPDASLRKFLKYNFPKLLKPTKKKNHKPQTHLTNAQD